MSGRREQAERAAFESTTQGLGKKLLMRMGWKEGSGLGKEGEGIVNPVEVNLRPKGVGIGFVDEPDARRTTENLYSSSSSSGPAPADDSPHARPWKRTHIKRDPAYAADAAPSPFAGPVKIIDMTGRGAAAGDLPGHWSHDAAGEAGRLGGLCASLRQLAVRSEAEARQLQQARRSADQRLLQVEAELAGFRETLRQMQAALAAKQQLRQLAQTGRMQAAMVRAACLAGEDTSGPWKALFRTGDQLEALFREQQDVAAVRVCLALFSEALAVPLARSSLLEDAGMAELFRALGEYEFRGRSRTYDVAQQLLLQLWVPRVRPLVLAGFDPRDARMLAFFRAWGPLLRGEAERAVYGTLLDRRLAEAVDESDLADLTAWFPAWVPLLRSPELVAAARRRVTRLLEQAGLADPGLRAAVGVWRAALPPAEADLVLGRAVMPMLSRFLERTLVIDPADQELGPLLAVLAWADDLPAAFMGAVLRAGLFAKLRRTLHAWMAADPDFDEVSQWYEAWRAVLPEPLQSSPLVQQEYARLLVMINELLDDPRLPLDKFL